MDGDNLGDVEVHHGQPAAAEHPPTVHGERIEQTGPRGRTDDDGSHVEGVGAGIVHPAVEHTDLLHVDAVDGVDRLRQRTGQRGVGQLHGELVHRPAGTPLEDVDADDLGAERADAARHLAQRPGAIGQPDTDDVRLHDRHGTTYT